MNDYERAHRITAWTWAAQVLGVPMTQDRIDGLVDVTARVRLENLKPALEAVIQSEPAGFLPSPGAVISAAHRIAERASLNAPRLESGDRDEIHRKWMAENNLEHWSTEQWRVHRRLLKTKPYFDAIDKLNERRHKWAADMVCADLKGRPATMKFRIDLRKDYNKAARTRFPTPDPLDYTGAV